MSRLTIDITDQQHQRLKAVAALQGKSIRQYAIERLFPGQADDDRAWRELQELLDRRIEQALAGAVSEQGFDAIVNEEFGQESEA